MNKRICSLETEYALVSNLLTKEVLSREQLADLVEEAILDNHLWVPCNSFGRRPQARQIGDNLIKIREGQFIANGSRVYYDVGHFEWANPETLDPRSALLYDKAAERNLAEAVALANEQLQKTYPDSWVMLVKNNIDYHGEASYGCHENYSLRRYDDQGQDVFTRLVDDLAPFLVTRQIFCGSGRIGTRLVHPDDPVAFQLSQRADFIEVLQSAKTREERSLLNLRDEPLADQQKWRRLHLILGDSNMAEFATFLKIGTTSLILDLVEANLLRGRWALRDPIGALHRVSREGQGTALPLQQGGQATALEIQRGYRQLAQQMVSSLPVTHFAHQIVGDWGQTLDDLARGGTWLHQRFDWAIKLHHFFDGVLQAANTDWEELGYWNYVVEQTNKVPLPADAEADIPGHLRRYLPQADVQQLEHYVEKNRLDWRFYVTHRRLLNKLREIDFRYHDINPKHSLYALLTGQNGKVERIITPQEIVAAQRNPPENTRAWQRGQIITLSLDRNVKLEMDWDKVSLVRSNRMLAMPDPFAPVQINLDRVPEFGANRNVEINIISVEDLTKD